MKIGQHLLKTMRRAMLLLALIMSALPSRGEGSGGGSFFNLTADEVRIDTLLPAFHYAHPLGAHYADSTYTVEITYPEFIDMSPSDIKRYQELSGRQLGEMPEVVQSLSISRKQGTLHIGFVPLVYRDGKYQKLVSFRLEVKGKKIASNSKRAAASKRRTADERYVSESVLATGSWAKISVPATGIYQLTSDLIRQAGFTDINKVKVYGYGGALQPERLTGDYLEETDDLQEVPLCEVDGKRLFFAVGPVSWDDSHQRIRNPYSSYGYYFLTQNDDAPQTISWTDLLATHYPSEDHYCSLYEVDDYAWFSGGRNLYDATLLYAGKTYKYTVAATGTSSTGSLTVALSGLGIGGSVTVALNGKEVGYVSIPSVGSYDKMRTAQQTFTVDNLQASNEVTLTPDNNIPNVRLDYLSTYSTEPVAAPESSQNFPTPAYVYNILNQNHHADKAADMVIVIPTTQKLLAQAERLKKLHEQKDGLRVNIVPADELFNEFSSGTPDANAYRRYMKMLYDRAETDDDMPRFLLLLGDCAWDNRMLSPSWKGYSPDDYLLCYESENSYSQTHCYVSDDYFCMLDDGEGGNMISSDQADAAVGRIPARTADEAAIVVDKIENYMNNQQAGSWQNLLCFMGDDGNNNVHMADADSVARLVETRYPDFVVKRIMWDAYTRVSSSTGNSYPDATRLIKQYMQQGALIINYSGHGSPGAISHEYVLKRTDFESAVSQRLPLWVTASCDIMPFDGQEENIGETALFNKKGGAVAFYGTTRTVYQPQNRLMNLAFTNRVLSKDEDGDPMPIGEAVRLAKNELISTGVILGYDRKGDPVRATDQSTNRLQYSLLGDPAMYLAMPTQQLKIESINDTPLTDGTVVKLKAGSTAKVAGRILTDEGQTDTSFNGTMTAVVRDVKEEIVCRLNNTTSDGADVPFIYYDRVNTLFNGSDQVKEGLFTFTFAVPKDISYSDDNALINVYAVNGDKTIEASGRSGSLILNGQASQSGSEAGPSIYCYLNSEAFSNGDAVNQTPYFVALLNDEDGINVSGSGIGHDLQLIIDGQMAATYNLNDYFQYDFGSYTKGQVGFSIPTLSYGQHKLLFRAWDVLNNSSTAELAFNVVKGLEPQIVSVECSPNPAKTNTTFRVVHDRTGSEMDVKLDIFDTSGRHLWTHSENGVPTDQVFTLNWDLTTNEGRRLNTGLYLYRISISSDGSDYSSKAQKLIILNK